MGSDALFARFMTKFSDDPTYAALEQALAQQDMEKALSAAHTLKGMCGNLSMKELEALFARQVALFRAEQFAAAKAMMPQIESAYRRVTAGVRRCWP